LIELLQRLQDSGLGVWVSTAPTIWAYPTILMLHTVGLAMVVGPAAVLDLRLLGAGARMPLVALQNVFRVIWIGFAINASTGLALFISEATEKGTARVFYVKLALIALALIVTIRIRRAVFGGGGAETAQPVTARTKGMAAASLALWFSAIAAGRLMAYVK
jgi:hypothetical protein